MTEKRYKSVKGNLECSNGMEYMLVKRDDGFNVCQVCSKYTAKEIVDELNNLADENEQLKEEIEKLAYANDDLLKEKREWKKLSDEYAKLYEENKELKDFIRREYPKYSKKLLEDLE